MKLIESKQFKYILYAVIAVFVIFNFMGKKQVSAPIKPYVEIGGQKIFVEIADTDQTRAQGLSGHAPLGDNEGMLFIFPELGTHGFWMKDMLFPIDIIWFDDIANSADGVKQIIYIKKSATPESYPEIFSPMKPSKYILEVPAG